MRDDNYSYAIKIWGEPTDFRCVGEEVIQNYESIFPLNVLRYWRQEGFCQFRHGLLFSVNPGDWQPTVDEWVAGTPYERFGRFYALTRSAFGKVFLFNEEIGATAKIDSLLGNVYSYKTDIVTNRAKEISAGMAFTRDPEELDCRDEHGNYLFERALAKLGPVGWDEMYAFEPALALGGTPRLENLVKVDWRVHMTLLRQMTDVHVPFTDINLPKGVL